MGEQDAHELTELPPVDDAGGEVQGAAAAKGRGRRAAASSDAYNAAQSSTYNQHEAPYDIATQIIARYAVEHNYLQAEDLDDPDGGWSKLTNPEGPANTEYDFADLLHDINADKHARDGMTAIIQNYDRDFSGAFDEESLARLANNGRNGARARYNRARKAGDKKGMTDAKKSEDNYSKSSMIIRASAGTNAQQGFMEQNEHQRAVMDNVLREDSGATPLERQEAIQAYQGWLNGDGKQILGQVFKASEFDPVSPDFNPYAAGLLGRIKGTLDMLNGQPSGKTLKDDVFGFDLEDPGQDSDAIKTGSQVAGLQNGLQAVSRGESIVLRVGDDGETPDPRGSGWAIFGRNSPELEGRELIPFAVPSRTNVPLQNGEVLGGNKGDIRYTVAEPVRIAMYAATDPRTGAGTMPMKQTPLEEQTVGSRVEWTGPDGQLMEIWGVVVNGQKIWTPNNPFTEQGRMTPAGPGGGAAGTRDPDGNYVIAYQSPVGLEVGQGGKIKEPPPFTVGDRINYDMLRFNDNGRDSVDGTAWNPAVDKELGYQSPMTALAHTSSQAGRWMYNQLGKDAIKNSETEYWAQPANWTPQMRQQAGQGVPPERVVDLQASKLNNKLESDAYWGDTPEMQQSTRKFMQQRADAETAARLGVPVDKVTADRAISNDDIRRAELQGNLTKWGISTKPVITGAGVTIRGGVPTVAPQNQAMAWAAQGWNVRDMLNQPGMTLAQANDLAARISGGAVGQLMPDGTEWTQQPGMTGPSTMPRATIGGGAQKLKSKPYVNPYLTSSGQVPTRPTTKPKVSAKPVDPLAAAMANKTKDDVYKPPTKAKVPKGVDPKTWNAFGGGGPGASGV